MLASMLSRVRFVVVKVWLGPGGALILRFSGGGAIHMPSSGPMLVRFLVHPVLWSVLWSCDPLVWRCPPVFWHRGLVGDPTASLELRVLAPQSSMCDGSSHHRFASGKNMRRRNPLTLLKLRVLASKSSIRIFQSPFAPLNHPPASLKLCILGCTAAQSSIWARHRLRGKSACSEICHSS